MVKRKTKEQIHLQKVMEALLHLHVCISKEMKGKKKLDLKKIFEKVIIFLQNYFDMSTTKTTTEKNKLIVLLPINGYESRYYTEFNEQDIIYLFDTINLLRENLESNGIHFTKIRTFREEEEYYSKNYEPYQQFILSLQKDDDLKNELIKSNEKIIPKIKKTTIYEISLMSPFARSLFDNVSKNSIKISGYPLTIETPSFKEILQNILVNYFLAFGNYNSIKVCKHCETFLAVEKRNGQKLYCSDQCRVAYFNKKHPEGRYKCKNRQNRWIKDKFDNLGYKDVGKYPCVNMYLDIDCADCKKYQSGGNCKKVHEKNPWIKSLQDSLS